MSALFSDRRGSRCCSWRQLSRSDAPGIGGSRAAVCIGRCFVGEVLRVRNRLVAVLERRDVSEAVGAKWRKFRWPMVGYYELRELLGCGRCECHPEH